MGRPCRIISLFCSALLLLYNTNLAFHSLPTNTFTPKVSLLCILNVSILHVVFILDIAYAFVLCGMSRLGSEPMSIMYGFASGGALILSSMLTVILIFSDNINPVLVKLVGVISIVVNMISAIIHIKMAVNGWKELPDDEKTCPIRREVE